MIKVYSTEVCYNCHWIDGEREAAVRKYAAEHDCTLEDAIREMMYNYDESTEYFDIWEDYETYDSEWDGITNIEDIPVEAAVEDVNQ